MWVHVCVDVGVHVCVHVGAYNVRPCHSNVSTLDVITNAESNTPIIMHIQYGQSRHTMYACCLVVAK